MASWGLPRDNDALSLYSPCACPQANRAPLVLETQHKARLGSWELSVTAVAEIREGPQASLLLHSNNKIKVLISKYILDSILGKRKGRRQNHCWGSEDPCGRSTATKQKSHWECSWKRNRELDESSVLYFRVIGSLWEFGTEVWYDILFFLIWYPVRGAWRKNTKCKKTSMEAGRPSGRFYRVPGERWRKPTPEWGCWRCREMVKFKIYIIYFLFIN